MFVKVKKILFKCREGIDLRIIPSHIHLIYN